MRKTALGLSLVFIFFIPWEDVIEFPGLGSGTKILGFVLAAFWLATVIVTGRLRKPGPLQIVFYLFVAWNVVSTFWSVDPDTTVAQMRTWAQLLGMVIILWDLYTTRAAILAGLQTFILGEYVGIAFSLSNFFSGTAFYTHGDRYSPAEQSNPDGFGIILAIGIPVAWYLASLDSDTKFSTLLKLVNYIYIPAAFTGIALSGTRTALVASLPAMAFGLASLNRIRLSTRIAIFLSFTIIVFILLPYVQPLKSFQRLGTTATELTAGDLNNRTNNWGEGLASFAEHPLLGVGSDMYRSVNRWGKLAHNSFLSVLVELGLIGFGLFGLMLAIAVHQALKQSKWDSRFWLIVLLVWAIGASSLTYEHRKATWLILSFVVASAATTSKHEEAVAVVQHEKSGAIQLAGAMKQIGTTHDSPYLAD
jgi:O-antigen ligase